MTAEELFELPNDGYCYERCAAGQLFPQCRGRLASSAGRTPYRVPLAVVPDECLWSDTEGRV